MAEPTKTARQLAHELHALALFMANASAHAIDGLTTAAMGVQTQQTALTSAQLDRVNTLLKTQGELWQNVQTVWRAWLQATVAEAGKKPLVYWYLRHARFGPLDYEFQSWNFRMFQPWLRGNFSVTHFSSLDDARKVKEAWKKNRTRKSRRELRIIKVTRYV